MSVRPARGGMAPGQCSIGCHSCDPTIVAFKSGFRPVTGRGAPEVQGMGAEGEFVAGARTRSASWGALAGFTAMDLGGFTIAEALSHCRVCTQTGRLRADGPGGGRPTGSATPREAAAKAGVPMSVPANTVNKVCLSGLNTIYLADQMIRAGDADIVVAGGIESVTERPILLPRCPCRLPHRGRGAGGFHDVQ